MRAYEIWPGLSEALNHELLEAACLRDKRLYRKAVQDLGAALHKRAHQLLELPRAARHELLRAPLGLAKFDTLGYNLIINWLRGAGEPMLVMFLDGLGIAHDGHGCAEKFPEALADARLEQACRVLYERFPAEQATLYLRVFPNITGVAWGVEVEKFVRPAAPPVTGA
ncbi:MAG: hypothetical protein LBK60_08755 [Verrucomicrobiales bacterium]|jgi:hypothetical protein|nr:hypothetical protein [Verrucomicrobiales bacterium]